MCSGSSLISQAFKESGFSNRSEPEAEQRQWPGALARWAEMHTARREAAGRQGPRCGGPSHAGPRSVLVCSHTSDSSVFLGLK